MYKHFDSCKIHNNHKQFNLLYTETSILAYSESRRKVHMVNNYLIKQCESFTNSSLMHVHLFHCLQAQFDLFLFELVERKLKLKIDVNRFLCQSCL